jgi:hypothetical protein
MTTVRLANKIQTILCDDVRTETGNKFSLMGIYGQSILFKKVPAALPQLCLCIMIEGVKVDFQELNVTLKCPEAEATHLKLSLSKENQVGLNIVLFAKIIPFRAKATGPAKLEVRVDKNKRPSIIHRFEIKQATP